MRTTLSRGPRFGQPAWTQRRSPATARVLQPYRYMAWRIGILAVSSGCGMSCCPTCPTDAIGASLKMGGPETRGSLVRTAFYTARGEKRLLELLHFSGIGGTQVKLGQNVASPHFRARLVLEHN